MWDVIRRRLTRKLSTPTITGTGIAMTGDGVRVFSATDGGLLRIMEASTGDELASLSIFRSELRVFAVTSDGSRTAALWDGLTLRIWDTRPPYARPTQVAARPHVKAIAVDRRHRAVVGLSNGALLLSDIDRPTTGAKIGTHNEVTAVAISSDGAMALSGARDGSLRLWDIRSMKALRTICKGGATIVRCIFGPDGTMVGAAGGDGTLTTWDLSAKRVIQSFRGPTEQIMDAVVSPDGRYALWLSDGCELWRQMLDDVGVPLRLIAESTLAYAIGRDNNAIVADSTGSIQRIDLSNGAVTQLPPIEWGFRPSLAFISNDLSYMAATSAGGRIRVSRLDPPRSNNNLPSLTVDAELTCCVGCDTDPLVIAAGDNRGQLHFLALQGARRRDTDCDSSMARTSR